MQESSYRPHNPGHDYYEDGIYLITLVVTGREPRLSMLNDSSSHPDVVLTHTGNIVHEEWEKTSVIQASKGRSIEILCQVCMPEHWHGVIHVKERMDISLGSIINAFKSACTSRWRKEITGYLQSPCTANMIRHSSKEHRQAYYATRPLIERPLFDDDYDDTICMNEEHRKRMIAYVNDNPRRAIYRKLFPQFMQRQMHIRIDGVDYASFGNLFLLRWANKQQVFCHRKARLSQLNEEERKRFGYENDCDESLITTIPYEHTESYQKEHDGVIEKILLGATVVVTPGISKGEQRIKNECIEHGYPLIHLQKEPIGKYWKPEHSRFEACIQGNLLILSPWQLDSMTGDVEVTSDYFRFHNLNTLASKICSFEGDARILKG